MLAKFQEYYIYSNPSPTACGCKHLAEIDFEISGAAQMYLKEKSNLQNVHYYR